MYRLMKAGITHTHTHTHTSQKFANRRKTLRSEVSRAQEVDEARKLPLGCPLCVCAPSRSAVYDSFTAPHPSCLSHQGVPPGTVAIDPEAEDFFSKSNLTT